MKADAREGELIDRTHQEGDRRAEPVPDLRVPLDTLAVYLPEEPMLINGRAFTFEVHHDALAAAVHRANHRVPGETPSVKALFLGYGESLPTLLADAPDQERVYDAERRTLSVVVPKEVVKSALTDDQLSILVQASLNDQLRRGLLEVVATNVRRRRWRRFYMVSALTVAPLAGIGTGLVWEGPILDRGIAGIGASVGVVAVSLATTIKGTERAESTGFRWARGVEAGRSFFRNFADDEGFTEPFISVVYQHHRQ